MQVHSGKLLTLTVGETVRTMWAWFVQPRLFVGRLLALWHNRFTTGCTMSDCNDCYMMHLWLQYALTAGQTIVLERVQPHCTEHAVLAMFSSVRFNHQFRSLFVY